MVGSPGAAPGATVSQGHETSLCGPVVVFRGDLRPQELRGLSSSEGLSAMVEPRRSQVGRLEIKRQSKEGT